MGLRDSSLNKEDTELSLDIFNIAWAKRGAAVIIRIFVHFFTTSVGSIVSVMTIELRLDFEILSIASPERTP